MERPELAVLLAYAKRSLEPAMLGSTCRTTRASSATCARYFPPAVVERFGHLLAEHPLRRELIATINANDVVNSLGRDVRLPARRRARRRSPPTSSAPTGSRAR